MMEELRLPIVNDLPMFWVGIPTLGKKLIPVPGSGNASFLPIKSPIRSELQKVINKKRRWGPDFILEKCNELIKEIPITYVVLDLDKNNNVEQDWEKKAIYKNVPIQSYTQKEAVWFAQEVKKYLEELSDANRLIFLVSSLDGSNKAGFAICSYLTCEADMDYNEALKLFAESKDPGIYDHGVLESLAICQKAEVKEIPKVDEPSWLQENKHIGKDRSIQYPVEYTPGLIKFHGIFLKDPKLIDKIQTTIDEFKHPNLKKTNSTILETVEVWNPDKIQEFKDGLFRVTFQPRGSRVIVVINDRRNIFVAYGRDHIWKFQARVAERCPLPLVCTAVSLCTSHSLKIFLTDILRAGGVDFQSSQLDLRLSTLFYDVLRDVEAEDRSVKLLYRPVGRIFDAPRLVDELGRLERSKNIDVEGVSLLPYQGGPGRSIFLPGPNATVLLLFRCISKADACLYARTDDGDALVPFSTIDFRKEPRMGALQDYVVRFRVGRKGDLEPIAYVKNEAPDTISFATGVVENCRHGEHPRKIAAEWARIADEKSKAGK